MDMLESGLFAAEMFVVGIGVGLIGASLGLGGGILMVPAFLTFVPGMDVHTAKGTSLFLILWVALVNAWRLNRKLENKPWRLAALMALGAIGGSYAGAYGTTLLPERTVLALFLALLVALALRTFLLRPKVVNEDEVRQRLVLPASIGLLAGVAGGATGTGGGAVMVPLALMAGVVSNARVSGLSNMVMVGTSAAGALAHWQAEAQLDAPWVSGQIYLPVVPMVFLGAQLGSPMGKWINDRMPLHYRRVAMGVMLLVIAVRLGARLMSMT